ncbi:facilitated trehalose transporter Tret1 [Leptopilina heterotoma]|uniref:facilitated trehalose transporter Tret1 n=1 Tax=Leptopilina heterotoma TaxID=63436 RepID=UPI001CAA3DE7|nr:facilitated trehalose transporter Tret1 [Leptopilina heterotoma]
MTQLENFDNFNSNGEKVYPMEANGHVEEPTTVNKFKRALPQFLAVGAKNMLLLTFGTTLGFATILIPALKEGIELKATTEERNLIGSLNLFLVPVGCFCSGPISQTFGRKRTMMMMTVPFITSWIIFYYSYNMTMIYVALVISGLTGGLSEAPVLTYVAEITEPTYRGMLSATSTMTVILGIFLQMLTGSLVSWKTTALINILYPVMCFCALFFVPESPYWLASKGRIAEAERSLCWLRGWTSPTEVNTEFHQITDMVKSVKINAKENSILKNLHHYNKKNFYKPFILVAITFFVSTFNGSLVLQTNAVEIFEGLKSPIEKYTATVFLGLTEFVSSVVCAFIIHILGKRKLTFFSVGGTFFCYLLLAIYGYLIRNNHIDTSHYAWLPTTLLIGSAFFSHVGIRLIPWVLSGEVFSSQVRGTATGIAGSLYYIFGAIANLVFEPMTTWITLPGTFVFNTCINLVGVITLYFIMPETEGRTLKEIEEHYLGIQKLKHRPTKEKIASKEKWAATNPQPINDDLESKI